MTESLSRLIEMSRSVRATAAQQEEQRRSFAFGNTALENPRITREMVDEQAESLARE